MHNGDLHIPNKQRFNFLEKKINGFIVLDFMNKITKRKTLRRKYVVS